MENESDSHEGNAGPGDGRKGRRMKMIFTMFVISFVSAVLVLVLGIALIYFIIRYKIEKRKQRYLSKIKGIQRSFREFRF